MTLWTIASQTPLSMGFSRQEYWSGLPCSPPGHLPNPEIEPTSLTSPALTGRFLTTSTTWEAQNGGNVQVSGRIKWVRMQKHQILINGQLVLSPFLGLVLVALEQPEPSMGPIFLATLCCSLSKDRIELLVRWNGGRAYCSQASLKGWSYTGIPSDKTFSDFLNKPQNSKNF